MQQMITELKQDLNNNQQNITIDNSKFFLVVGSPDHRFQNVLVTG